jgi:hypothetical protein
VVQGGERGFQRPIGKMSIYRFRHAEGRNPHPWHVAMSCGNAFCGGHLLGNADEMVLPTNKDKSEI